MASSGSAGQGTAGVDWAAWNRAWGGVVALAFVNGASRRVYEPVLGESRAHQVSSVVLLLLTAPWVRRAERRHPLETTRDALSVGASWAAATVLFEFGFGHYLSGDSWEDLLDAYDLRAGQLWVLDVVGIAAAPALARAWRLRHADRLRGRRAR